MKSNRFVIPLISLGMLTLLSATPSVAAIFLETDPAIDGDVVTVGFEDQINIVTLNTGGTNAGCSGSPGATDLVEATFTKEVDSATVGLLTALRDRTLLQATFSLTANFGGPPATYHKYEFQDGLLTSYGKSDEGDAGVAGIEVWTLSFSQVTITYTEYDGAGNPFSTQSVVMTPSQCVGN